MHIYICKIVYLNFLHLQRNDLPKIIGFKIHMFIQNNNKDDI